jgi:hypothetical protein
MSADRSDFVPFKLSAAAPKDESFRARVLQQVEKTQPFTALRNPGAELAASGASGPHATCGPKVSLQRDGDRIASIRVECSCGQVIELNCVY